MELMHQLDTLAVWFYSRLDKGRLKDEILAVLNGAGIVI